ncbi:hypothetical protein DSL72_006229 [Monilinia vaccinii-corymbosi]|uniref:Uncharacterized protein n=1 Tax=Monilinia vaccinii-corymbosi TaxID=61207 RepID=A0A8A3PMX1_9HELO|nr:hypothetical protein DSL72_006229 [Monilinia vaccinii-corymbosi]
MEILSTLFECCYICGDQRSTSDEKPISAHPYKDHPSRAELVDEFVAKLFAAEKNDAILQADLESTIHTYGWYDGFAASILAALENAIRRGQEMAPAMKSAYVKAIAGVKKIKEWAEAHPEMAAVIVTLVAIGVLALLTPWLMGYLGFAEEGIVEGSWAAGWQATFESFVPKGSLDL